MKNSSVEVGFVILVAAILLFLALKPWSFVKTIIIALLISLMLIFPALFEKSLKASASSGVMIYLAAF